MAVDKPTISMDPELRVAAEQMARQEGRSFSAFVSDAVASAVRRRQAATALFKVVEEWESEHGAISGEELRAAAHELGVVIPESSKAVPKPAKRPRRPAAS